VYATSLNAWNFNREGVMIRLVARVYYLIIDNEEQELGCYENMFMSQHSDPLKYIISN